MFNVRIVLTVLVASLAICAVAPMTASAQSPIPIVFAQGKATDAGGDRGDGGSTGAERAGKQLGKILNSWTLSLAFAIAGVMALVALGRRNFGEMAVIAGITFVGSMFFLDDGSPARSLFKSILDQIT